MIGTPTLSIPCITCMQQREEGGNNKGHESPGKIRLDGFVSVKHYGGTGGHPWDDGMHHGVREITVASGKCIDSIRVAYDKDGKLVNADKHGGHGGSVNPQIKLEYPDEFLVSVSGNYYEAPWAVCNGQNPVVIRSLKFKSNRRTFGPFGIEVGTPFSFTVEDGWQIVGMKGRSDCYLDAIGFHIAHAPKRKLEVHETCSAQEGRCNCKRVWGGDEIQEFWGMTHVQEGRCNCKRVWGGDEIQEFWDMTHVQALYDTYLNMTCPEHVRIWR